MTERVPLSDAVGHWDRAAAQVQLNEAEALRRNIVAKFPLDQWAEMPLATYALGSDPPQETWCWWMEFNSQELGSMRGGAAQKHLIFKRKARSGWYYSPTYANEEEAWKAIRAGFVQAFDLAKEGRYPEIDAIAAIEGGQAIRTKSLYVYFPDSLLPIYSTAHIAIFTKLFGDEVGNRGVVAANRHLMDVLIARPEFQGWSGWELMRFLYSWADPRETLTVVKIAPGEQARFWEASLAGGYISVGWSEVGDLRQYPSRDDFKEKFASIFEADYGRSPATASKKGNELWTLMELSPGDIVIANKGTAEVVGIGTVVEPGYVWRPDLGEYSHTVSVRWDDTTRRTIEPVKKWATTTVARVPNDLYEKIRHTTAIPPRTQPPVAPDDLALDIEAAVGRHKCIVHAALA